MKTTITEKTVSQTSHTNEAHCNRRNLSTLCQLLLTCTIRINAPLTQHSQKTRHHSEKILEK